MTDQPGSPVPVPWIVGPALRISDPRTLARPAQSPPPTMASKAMVAPGIKRAHGPSRSPLPRPSHLP